MRILPRSLRILRNPVLHRFLDSIRGPRLVLIVDQKLQRVDQARVSQAIERDDMEIAAADEDAVGAGLGVDPAGEMKGGFDEEELAVVIADADREGREAAGDLEEEKDDEPLVLNVVAEAELAVEVGEGGIGGDGEGEGVVLPNVGGGEGGDELEDLEMEGLEEQMILSSTFDSHFVSFVNKLEASIRESIVDVYSHPTSEVAVMPAEMEQKSGENDKDYIKRLKSFVEKQCSEIQNLLGRNATLAEDLAKIGGGGSSQPDQGTGRASERVQAEKLRRDLQEAHQRIEILKSEKAKLESEASMYQNLAGKTESDLKSLSDAYNSLEQANFQLEKEVQALKSGGAVPGLDIEAIKAEAREEAMKESETELNDLLVCLGQEQSKVEKLSVRLEELGEDVEKLLEGIGDETGLPDDEEDDDEE